MDVLVPFSKEPLITNTLCSFLVAMVIRLVGGWTAFSGKLLLDPACYSHALHSPT